MAYDEQTFRRGRGDEPDGEPAAYRTAGYAATDYRGRRRDAVDDQEPEQPAELAGRHAGRSLEAQRSWSDDRYSDSGRDRLGIHVGWEIILLVGVGALAFLLYQLDPTSLRTPALSTLLVSATFLGLLALGAGLSLRAAVPNLAIGPIAIASALHFAENGDDGLVAAIVPAALLAAAGGLIVAVVVVAFHVPGWVATLAGAMGVIVYNQLRVAPVDVQSTFDPTGQAFILFGGFAGLAVLGGALGTVTPIRRLVGRMRSQGDPAVRRTPSAAVPVAGALVISSLLAVAAGVLFAAQSPGPVAPGAGLEWTGFGLGLALLAGTSAYGRRGGILGTLLAVAGMALFLDYARRRDFDIALFATAASTVAAGLIITRLVETYGRSLPVLGSVSADWDASDATETNWSPDLPEAWAPAVPVQDRTDRWDDRWGTGRR